MTQHEKIIHLCKDEKWHCQNEFRALYIFSPHKRRCEIEGRKNRREPVTGEYEFFERDCEHGVKGQKDYMMVRNADYKFKETCKHCGGQKTELMRHMSCEAVAIAEKETRFDTNDIRLGTLSLFRGLQG